MTRPLALSLALCVGSLLACSCFGNRAVPDIKAEVPVAQKRFVHALTDSTAQNTTSQSWCTDFGSKSLRSLVDISLAKNRSLQVSWTRLRQIEAQRDQVHSNFWPTVDLEGSASTSKQQFFGGGGGGGPGGGGAAQAPAPTSVRIEQYRLSASAGYEVDLWGKLAANREAVDFDVEATKANLEAAAMTIAASTAEAWFDLVATRQKEALLRAQLKLNQDYLKVLSTRLSYNQATLLDVTQQNQQITTTQGQLEQTEQTKKIAIQRLLILTGLGSHAQDKLPLGDEEVLPPPGALPSLGVPGDLLERRPDLRAASARLMAANRRIAVAVRDRLPSLRLSASLFLQAFELGSLLEEWLWSVAANASQPVMDGGRRAAAVEQAEWVQKEAVASYADALIGALGEVEQALILDHHQAAFVATLETQLEQANLALSLSQSRYQQGTIDFLRVLTSLQSLQTLERSVVDAKRLQLTHRISLCRALGGTWTSSLTPPKSLK